MTVQRHVPMHALEGKRAEMINFAAAGALQLTELALAFITAILFYRAGKRDGVEEYKRQLAENRSQRRGEMRLAPRGRHHLAPFPGDDELFERKPADTGELRELSAMAEAGELDRIRGENAAFFRTWDLRQWTHKRETAS